MDDLVGRETFRDIVLSRAGDSKVGLDLAGHQWSWAEVVRESLTRASALSGTLASPNGRQRRVGVLLDNIPDYVFWLGACAVGGNVLVGINPTRSPREISADVTHVGVDLIITESRHLSLLSAVGPGGTVWVVDTPAYADWLAPHADAKVPTTAVAAGDVALLLFSSGSTGAPKAVIVSQGRLARLTSSVIDRIGLRRDSVTYLCMPLFHGQGLMMNLAPAWALGATVGLTPKFSASAFSTDVHRLGATYVNHVGRALSYVLAHEADPRDATSTLELAYGTEASPTDIDEFAARFGCEVMEGYGMSEGVLRIARTPTTPPGALGLPMGAVDVQIRDEATGLECPRARLGEDGRLLNSDAVGQIVAVGGAVAFEGYWDNPEASADRVRGADFWTGDLGYRDEQGWFWFAGRGSDWLRVDGENFSAAQVERVLAAWLDVAAVAAYAVPDPVTGDQVMAAVELRPGTEFRAADWGEFLAGRADLGDKQWPQFVRVIDAMPVTGSNKIDKAPLRETAWVTSDPVWVRVGRTHTFVPLDEAARQSLRQRFADAGRAALCPA